MPVLDGFKVLQLMSENNITDLPVIMITAEATKENVTKAAKYNISGFISKPFEPKAILDRLRTMFDIHAEAPAEDTQPKHVFGENDIAEINTFIASLSGVYKTYLKNNNLDEEKYVRVIGLMEILLNEYASATKDTSLDSEHIYVISQAAYFYDIGLMGIPDNLITSKLLRDSDKKLYESHTSLGANIIWCNHAPTCRYFVETCADMCMHHHERADGNGYPHKMNSEEISIYTQMCTIAINFDKQFDSRTDQNERNFELVVERLRIDGGAYNDVLLDILDNCKSLIVMYYSKFRLE
jgi:putative two-component system response regulator